MSELSNAIRSNSDLHKALYEIVATLVAARQARISLGNEVIVRLCELAFAALPHIPVPKEYSEKELA